MEQTQKKKMPAGLKALVILLVVLLVLAGVPFLYLTFGGYPFLDAETAAKQPPMASTERYVFHGEDKTVDIAVSPGDIWWITQNTDLSEDLADVYGTLADYDLTLKSCGLSFGAGDTANVDAKLLYKGFLPLPLRAETRLSLTGRNLDITVTGISIGRLIHIDPAALPIGDGLPAFTVELPSVHSRMKTLTRLSTDKGNLILTCGLGRELVAEMLENLGQAETDAQYMHDNYPLMLSREFQAGEGGSVFSDLLAIWTADPAEFVSFKTQELVFSEDFKAGLYFSNQDGRFLPRFLPEITPEGVQAASDEWYGERTLRYTQLRDAVENLAAWNRGRRLLLGQSGYLDGAGSNAPVTLAALAGVQGAPDWVEPESVRILLGENANYYMTEPLDPIGKMPTADRSTLKGLKANEKYVPLLMLKTANGHPAVAYIQKGGTFTLLEIDQEHYQQAMEDPGMPVFDLMLRDYE